MPKPRRHTHLVALALCLPVWSALSADTPPPVTNPAAAKPALPACAPEKFRVAALQFVSAWGDVTANRRRLGEMCREAAKNGARIIVMCEAAIPGYHSPDLLTPWRDPVRRPDPKDGRSLAEGDVAESVPGPSTEYFGKLAKDLEVRILATLIEVGEVPAGAEGKKRRDYYNAAVLLNPKGEIEKHYRKLNPWPPGEATWAQKGDKGLGVVETEFGKLGLMICFDQTCGVADKLKAEGVTTILYPIGWVDDDTRAWFETRLPERVKGWGLNVVGANWSLERRPENGWQGYGYSRIIAADGAILARAKPLGSEIIYADLPRPPTPPR